LSWAITDGETSQRHGIGFVTIQGMAYSTPVGSHWHGENAVAYLHDLTQSEE